MNRHVVLHRAGPDLQDTVRRSLQQVGVLDRIGPGSRVALKPNLTYPYHRPGITTSPEVIRAVVAVVRERTPHVAVVETDGGYGTWQAIEAFKGHGLYQLRDEFGVEVVNLCEEPSRPVTFRAGWRQYEVPLPVRLLSETDVFITLPVPKIHCMTGVSLAYKNQWGCVPDIMRLRRHYLFDDAIVAINQALRPAVLADGRYFLDDNGPMEGRAVPMDLILAADSAGSFDRFVSEYMGIPWQRVGHLRAAVRAGDMPADLDAIQCHVAPAEARPHQFRLRRTFRNYIALAGFKSRFLTWFGYESWFGRVVLHGILYAIAGRPVKPQPDGGR